MRYLLDSGILLRLLERADPQHLAVRQALRALSTQGHGLATSSQNMAEFWNVCTRPAAARGGFGLSIAEAHWRLRFIERFVEVLREPPSAYAKWKSLVVSCKVQGRQVHDARLAAMMKSYRIKRILTLNPTDFHRYPGILAVTPQEVI